MLLPYIENYWCHLSVEKVFLEDSTFNFLQHCICSQMYNQLFSPLQAVGSTFIPFVIEGILRPTYLKLSRFSSGIMYDLSLEAYLYFIAIDIHAKLFLWPHNLL